MAGPRGNLPSEPRIRRLGVGAGRAGGERVLHAQIVIAAVGSVTILVVLLYLWRRPRAEEHLAGDAAVASASAAPALPVVVRTKVEPPAKPAPRVKLGPPDRVKCGASPKLVAASSSLCDPLPSFEQGLAKAIEDTVDCGPKEPKEGSINFVLTVDFRARAIRVYPGRSGSFRGKQAKKAADCVLRALGTPAWEGMAHQFRWYVLARMATYPPHDALDGLPDFR